MFQNQFNGVNPYQNFNVPMQRQSENTLIRVTGLEGAKAYQMPPNSTAALFDGGEDIMYIKSTDGAGFPTIRVFRFEPIESMPDAPGQVSREEFDSLRKEFEDVKQLIQRAGAKSKQHKAEAD